MRSLPTNEMAMAKEVKDHLLTKYLMEFYADFVPLLQKMGKDNPRLEFLHRLCYRLDETTQAYDELFDRWKQFFIPFLVKQKRNGKEYFGFEPNNKFTILVRELITEDGGDLNPDVLKKYANFQFPKSFTPTDLKEKIEDFGGKLINSTIKDNYNLGGEWSMKMRKK